MRSLTTFLALPVAATLVMGLSSCSLFSSGTSTATKDLKVGDCYNTVSDKAGGNNPVGEVTVVDCAKTHTYEVVAQTTFPDDVDKLPNEGAVKSSYQIEYLSPSEDTWAKGDRHVTCVVAQGDKSEVKGSAKDSKK